MAPLIISSPTAAAAFLLLDRLHEHCDAVATPRIDSTWEIRVELGEAPRDILPLALSAANEWVDRCGLRAVTVWVDGRTHLLHGSAAPKPAA